MCPSWKDHPASSHPVDGSGYQIARRIVYSLCLLPIVPVVAIIGAQICLQNSGLGISDELRCFQGLFSVLWVVSIIMIWRKVVLWTLGRKWLTALVSFIPFIQVLYGQPLWNIPSTGCIDIGPEMLCVGQHNIGVALWVWICVWIWWGWEKLQMNKNSNERPALHLSPVGRRLVMAVGYIPFMFGMFLVIAVALEDMTGWNDPLSEALAVSSLIAIAIWIMIWRRIVTWTRPVIRKTIFVACLTIVIPCAAQFALWDLAAPESIPSIILGVLPVVGWGLWMALTVMSWPIASEISEGTIGVLPRCIDCGYLLKGLRSTRCPECGAEPTIDELWAATAGHV